jgi:hypothetical protein
MHLQEENPDRIDECIRLYTDDAVWEAPARKVSYQGRELIKKMYLRVFNGVVDFEFTPVERFATPDRVFDDSYASFKITGDAFENCPYPIGTKVKMRLIHNFHIRDGLISREIGYEVWRRAGLSAEEKYGHATPVVGLGILSSGNEAAAHLGTAR